MKLLTSLAMIAFILGSCTYEDASDTAIVGGTVARENANDPLADLVINHTIALINNGQLFCTGTLIGPNHIISAAHCFSQPVNQLRLGYSTNMTPLSASVAGHYSHPHWNGQSNMYQDIAVIVFEGTVPANMKPVEIALPNELANYSQSSNVVAAGYGQTGDNAGDYGTLHYVKTRIAQVDSRNREHSLVEGEGKGTCQGDSGGPTYLLDDANGAPRFKLAGVTSRGGSCNPGNGINTNAPDYRDDFLVCAFRKLGKPLDSIAQNPDQVDCSQFSGSGSQVNPQQNGGIGGQTPIPVPGGDQGIIGGGGCNCGGCQVDPWGYPQGPFIDPNTGYPLPSTAPCPIY